MPATPATPAGASRTKRTALAATVAATVVAAALGVAGAASFPADAATPTAHGVTAVATKQVSYQGYRFTVPRSWAVIDLTEHPDTCVRFDRHAVYLGRPGADQACAGHLVGRTEALLVEPATNAAAVRGTVANTVAHEIDVTAARATVTATYGGSRAVVQQILTGAGLPAAAPVHPRPLAAPQLSGLAATASLADATNYTGKGFDTCSAPSTSTMSACTGTSPYKAVGIYFGGSSRSCSQPNLSASWVQTQYNAGWRFVPIYAGVQAANITSPTSEGTAAADDAVTQATALGLGAGSTLYYDMEQYSSGYSANVLALESAWTKELHAKGYHSAVYSSSSSGIADLAGNYNSGTYTMPDAIFDALWNGSVSTGDSTVPSADWSNHQRIHQYAGPANETWGGVTVNIDQDYLDVQLSGSSTAPMTNLTAGHLGSGHTDLVAIETATGNLYVYPGSGAINGNSTLGNRVQIGSNWGTMTDLTLGDFNKSGHDSLIAEEPSTGNLYLYPGTGTINGSSTLGNRVQIGSNWGGMTDLTAIKLGSTEGLLATETATGNLYFYPGSGSINGMSTLGNRVEVGTNWNTMSDLAAPGILNKDGKADLLAVDSSGNLYAYPFSGTVNGTSTFGNRVEIGTNWNSMSYLAGGDFNGDGTGDVVAVEAPSTTAGSLYVYPGSGALNGLNTLGNRTQIGTNW